MNKKELHEALMNKEINFSGISKLHELQENLNKSVRLLNESREKFYSNLFSGFLEVVKLQQEVVQNGIKNISNIIINSDNCFTDLYKYDWYLSLIIDITEISELSRIIELGNRAEIDKYMVIYYERNFDYLSTEIMKNYPKRSDVLNSAFKSHLAGEFNLSIPVFFTQIEGICQDELNTRYYSTKNSKPLTDKLNFEKYKDTSVDSFFYPLELIGNDRRKQDLNKPFGINRHDVLHGNSYDYGTKLNSLKVFSSLVYVNEIIEMINRNSE